MKRIFKKIRPEYFGAVSSGEKTFEIRKDEDNIQPGDILELREYDNGEYTGRTTVRLVGYVLRDCPEYGLMPGYCVVSLLF